MAINAAKLVTLRDDAWLREIVAGCELVNADGQAVVWASRAARRPAARARRRHRPDARLFAPRRASAAGGSTSWAPSARCSSRAVARPRERHPGSRSPATATATSPTTRSAAVCERDPRRGARTAVRRHGHAAQGVLPRRARPDARRPVRRWASAGRSMSSPASPSAPRCSGSARASNGCTACCRSRGGCSPLRHHEHAVRGPGGTPGAPAPGRALTQRSAVWRVSGT